jgi:hypothetical protein
MQIEVLFLCIKDAYIVPWRHAGWPCGSGKHFLLAFSERGGESAFIWIHVGGDCGVQGYDQRYVGVTCGWLADSVHGECNVQIHGSRGVGQGTWM